MYSCRKARKANVTLIPITLAPNPRSNDIVQRAFRLERRLNAIATTNWAAPLSSQRHLFGFWNVFMLSRARSSGARDVFRRTERARSASGQRLEHDAIK
jgi:hypothetical protein